MKLAEEFDSSLNRLRKLLSDVTTHTVELEVPNPKDSNVQNELEDVEEKLRQLNARLRADEERKQKLICDVTEKKKTLEQLSADLKEKENEITKINQKVADMEVRKLRASAGFSQEDARTKENIVNNIKAYHYLTGANFTNSSREGYIMNRETRKAKVFQILSETPRNVASEILWNVMKSTSNLPSDTY